MASGTDVIGHGGALAALEMARAKDMSSHAYLITGPAHVGKMTLALVLARDLNCVGGAEEPCPQCGRIDRGLHADVKVVPVDAAGTAHEDGRPRTVVTIEQVRAVSREAALRPFEGRCRVFIFEEADRLTEEASNALLKTLEEPPDSVCIVLLATGEQGLLPTIVSRCRLIPLRPVPWPQLASALEARCGLDRDRAVEFARTSGGRPGLALAMAGDEEFRTRFEETVDRIEAAAAADLAGRFEYAQALARIFSRDREAARRELVQWRQWWRDVLLASNGLGEFSAHVSRAASIGAAADAVGPGGAAAGLRAAVTAAGRLDRNVGPSLAIEQMMLSMPALAR